MRRKNLRKIFTLTVAPDGPTGRALDNIAADVVEIAREHANDILRNMPQDARFAALDAIQFRRDGRQIRVGIVNDGYIPTGNKKMSATQYLASKELREHVWLQPALEEAMNEFPEIISATSRFGQHA